MDCNCLCVCVHDSQRDDVTAVPVPVKRRHTGALVDRQSQLALPWKLRVLQMEPMSVDGIAQLSGFEVCSWFGLYDMIILEHRQHLPLQNVHKFLYSEEIV